MGKREKICPILFEVAEKRIVDWRDAGGTTRELHEGMDVSVLSTGKVSFSVFDEWDCLARELSRDEVKRLADALNRWLETSQ